MIKSVLSEKVEVRKSDIQGTGTFAKDNIKKGEIVFIKGGHILKGEELFTSSQINSYLPLGNNYFLAARTPEEEVEIKLYVNHSCEPNCGLRGDIVFIAIRDIEKDEELTFDYAFVDDEDYKIECHCGKPSCRKIITGFDWKLKELQDKYYDYFASYLKQKINNRGE
jgi:uncharacterized protein